MKQNGIRKVDVAVIGGGPAGAAIALGLLNRGYSTVVVERSDYSGARIGETLPPAIQPLLISLGVWDQFVAGKHSPSFGIRSAWGGEVLHDNDFIFNAYGAGWHVDRARFDAMLARCAEEAGATIYLDASLATCEDDTSGNWKIKITNGDQSQSLTARFLMDATGRTSWVARKQGARRTTLDRLIGIVYFSSKESALDSSTLIEAAENGWWYSAELPDNRLVLAYMTDADLYAKERKQSRNYFQRLLESTKHTRSRLGSKLPTENPRIVAANSSRLDFVAGRSWLAVGDAAMAFDPLSGQGVYKALQSAAHAARTIHEHWTRKASALDDYALAADRTFNNYLLKRRAFYAVEQRFPYSTFWQRRISN